MTSGKGRRHRILGLTALLVSALLALLPGVPANAVAAGRAASPRVTAVQPPGFLEVRDDGWLWYYERTDRSFTGHRIGGGWDRTSLVALLGTDGSFVEVKGDALRLWQVDLTGGANTLTFLGSVMGGWQNARLIAGVGDATYDGIPDFVEVDNRAISSSGAGTGTVSPTGESRGTAGRTRGRSPEWQSSNSSKSRPTASCGRGAFRTTTRPSRGGRPAVSPWAAGTTSGCSVPMVSPTRSCQCGSIRNSCAGRRAQTRSGRATSTGAGRTPACSGEAARRKNHIERLPTIVARYEKF